LRQAEPFFKELRREVAELVLTNLLALNRIGHHAERILAFIAENHPASVWAFLESRINKGAPGQDRYDAISYPRFYGLEEVLARDVAAATTIVRTWYKSGDVMFRFAGGRVLHALFPEFTDKLAGSLNKVIALGSDDDYSFAIHILENYHGEPSTHEVVKELVERLPHNDPKLRTLAVCLRSTGVVSGEFGMVEEYRKKNKEVCQWLEDSRPKVREFASAYIRDMEQRIASEQRSAEIENELWKRDYDTPIE
jgi:hypothetical protein